jgi:hypothetical protein
MDEILNFQEPRFAYFSNEAIIYLTGLLKGLMHFVKCLAMKVFLKVVLKIW